MKRYSLLINPLSPVHIGCGVDYEPLSYVMDPKHDALCPFNPGDLIDTLESHEFERLNEISDLPGETALHEMRSFINTNAENILEHVSNRVAVAPAIRGEYQRLVGSRRSSSLEISRTMFNPYSNRPIIPGSSLKGAVRTAVLSTLNRDVERPDSHRYQEKLLGGTFGEDPFRLIKIGDATQRPDPNRVSSRVIYAINRYRRDDGDLAPGKGVTVRLETIPSIYQPGYLYQSPIVLTDLGKVEGRVPQSDKHWSIHQLSDMCNAFYRPKLAEDISRLKGHNDSWAKTIETELSSEKPFGKRLENRSAFILRVGHHSGAESVTMDSARQIQIRRGRGQSSVEKQSTTQWFASDQVDATKGLLPFGWVIVFINKAA